MKTTHINDEKAKIVVLENEEKDECRSNISQIVFIHIVSETISLSAFCLFYEQKEAKRIFVNLSESKRIFYEKQSKARRIFVEKQSEARRIFDEKQSESKRIFYEKQSKARRIFVEKQRESL